ncbi:hypothetical protein A3D01_04950 [Candidatus Woesebacteria bacterium RIFCSPHIGHO2_02_FULL_39_13]|uniref:Methyltransferase type 11 domain-containing protein n=1 Tax=Candidatus Woesebacteria bacterium RIFCSPHIGHO2_02_FULL_39_13 TaxID=1802505 RepID=A0A1F7Z2C9_9BACT|nr:MAG: hypothetical protein A2692_00270 [Candidatus Woesebacteria bacterium RIFCSPHIGHO2_01_FULL_39_95]OGM32895.1 MAG: hypothetical protein A3D01_04950 [Candidatus Woesebacteria bacterium RIFCSPHIGHO2_02_FULL_39_13]OGM74408.1 MAG: hypothetical protein A3H19_05260 [Candidatus Woesebacteria bacterium RIFCSPLOWO2_12_FULL_39_9]
MEKTSIVSLNLVLTGLEREIEKIGNVKDRKLSLYSYSNDFFNFRDRYLSDLGIITSNLKKGSILEIGASPYHLSYCLKKLGYKLTAVDVNPNILKGFQKKHNIKTVKCDIERNKLPFKKNQFDMTLLNEVFEHLRINPLFAMREILRVLKPRGIFMLTTPNLYALHKIIRYLSGNGFNDPFEEFSKIDTYGYIGHIREYSNREIKNILSKLGFKVTSIYYRRYNNFADHPYLSTKPKKIIGSVFDITTSIIPQLRPFQIVISTKS